MQGHTHTHKQTHCTHCFAKWLVQPQKKCKGTHTLHSLLCKVAGPATHKVKAPYTHTHTNTNTHTNKTHTLHSLLSKVAGPAPHKVKAPYTHTHTTQTHTLHSLLCKVAGPATHKVRASYTHTHTKAHTHTNKDTHTALTALQSGRASHAQSQSASHQSRYSCAGIGATL